MTSDGGLQKESFIQRDEVYAGKVTAAFYLLTQM